MLKGVGRRVQIYVASEDVDKVGRDLLKTSSPRSTTASIPSPATASGTPRDVDGDGRFTILFSSWLDQLGGGRHAVDGFVRVADLDSSVPAPSAIIAT